LYKEITLLQRLRHPNIGLLLAIALDDLNNIFVVSEYVRFNKTLDYYIQRKECFKNKHKAQILFELAKTLNYLHHLEPAVIHRNLRPENVFITSEFKVKLVGFE
jgi:serine/threonine-protein kinase